MTAIFTQLIIPIQPVPITLGTMAVMMAGAVLGAHYGALSMIIYVLLGAAGLPVLPWRTAVWVSSSDRAADLFWDIS